METIPPDSVILEKIWNTVKDTLYITKEQFERSLAAFEILPEYTKEGDLIGAVIQNKASFHFVVFGIKWSLNKELLARWPGKIIEQYGYAETYTPLEDTRQHRFNKRIGFFETHRDDKYVYFRIEKLKMTLPNEVPACQL